MKCVQCQKNNNEVLRTESYDTVIIRRRKCLECGHQFPTYERIDAEVQPAARLGANKFCDGKVKSRQ